MDSNAKLDMLKKIQANHFAAYDMLLYLDTHKDDPKAFSMYRDLVNKTEELKNEYQKEYGPLTAFAAAQQSGFNWTESPWPWEKEGNK